MDTVKSALRSEGHPITGKASSSPMRPSQSLPTPSAVPDAPGFAEASLSSQSQTLDSPSASASTIPAQVSNPAWQFVCTHASQSASEPKAQAKKQLLVTHVLCSAKHVTQPVDVVGTPLWMQS